jgi:predicted HAD superfamily Cof-like phosphohydrolase
MFKMRSQLEEFHEKHCLAIGGLIPDFEQPDLRANLIEEEAKELVEAIRAGDMVETVDGICDLLYVVVGTCVSFGIVIDTFFDEVHRSNMTKPLSSKREDGKVVKGEGFDSPRIKKMLEELGWKGK